MRLLAASGSDSFALSGKSIDPFFLELPDGNVRDLTFRVHYWNKDDKVGVCRQLPRFRVLLDGDLERGLAAVPEDEMSNLVAHAASGGQTAISGRG